MIFVVGVMTGTSSDGMDAVVSRFGELSISEPGDILGTGSFAFPRELREKALTLQETKEVSKFDILSFSAEYGLFVGSRVREMLDDMKDLIDLESTVVSIHGQTIGHYPRSFMWDGTDYTLTWQVGEEAFISELTGLTVVSDFRSADVASCGRGAPLAPYYHRVILEGRDGRRGFLNVGGIANITIVDGGRVVLASDVGPGNMLIDGVVGRVTGGRSTYDVGGEMASSGTPSEALLKRIREADGFVSSVKPGTAGRENYGERFVDLIMSEAKKLGLEREDIVATVTRYTALCVREFVERHTSGLKSLWVGGGGAKNRALMGFLSSSLPGTVVTSSEELGISPEFVEAAAFAYLGALAIGGIPVDGASVTGGGKRILGKITPGANFRKVMEKVFSRRRSDVE